MVTDVLPETPSLPTAHLAPNRSVPQAAEPRGRWWKRGLLAVSGVAAIVAVLATLIAGSASPRESGPKLTHTNRAQRPGRDGDRTGHAGEFQQHRNQVQGPRVQHRALGRQGGHGGEGRRRTRETRYVDDRRQDQSAEDRLPEGAGDAYAGGDRCGGGEDRHYRVPGGCLPFETEDIGERPGSCRVTPAQRRTFSNIPGGCSGKAT